MGLILFELGEHKLEQDTERAITDSTGKMEGNYWRSQGEYCQR